MLTAARALAGARQLDIPFVDGDAEVLLFENDAFDAVVSTFGVMFTQSPEDAGSEMARVVRPGGRLVLAVWRGRQHLRDVQGDKAVHVKA